MAYTHVVAGAPPEGVTLNCQTFPQTYEAMPADEMFVAFLATVYDHLVKLTPATHGTITRFHAIKPPEISIKAYLERIQTYFGCSNECFVLSLVYIDRIVKMHSEFSVSILNVHRLLITSVMLAAKFFDDVYYSNAFYARVGGVRTREINILEAHFLQLLDFHLFVSPQEYDQYRKNVLAVFTYQHLQRPVQFPSASLESLTTSPTGEEESKKGAPDCHAAVGHNNAPNGTPSGWVATPNSQMALNNSQPGCSPHAVENGVGPVRLQSGGRNSATSTAVSNSSDALPSWQAPTFQVGPQKAAPAPVPSRAGPFRGAATGCPQERGFSNPTCGRPSPCASNTACAHQRIHTPTISMQAMPLAEESGDGLKKPGEADRSRRAGGVSNGHVLAQPDSLVAVGW